MNEMLTYLVKNAVIGRISRREFMGRAAALGLTAAASNSLLAQAVSAAGPRQGGIIRFSTQGGSTSDSLDPALVTNTTGTSINRMWGEPLVELAPHGGLEGKLADSWESSADAMTWTFKVRSGVTFSNGKTLTATDVARTLERHAGPDSKSGALGILRGIDTIQSKGDTVVIQLKGANADLPYLLTDYHLMIQPDGGFDDPTAAIGTGPYILKDVEMGVRVSAEKNPNYWGDLGHAAELELLVINDNTARVAALGSGQVDLIDRVPPRTAHLIDRQPNITVRRSSGPGHYVFIAHCDTEPFSNYDLRLALKHGIDREEMLDKILSGFGTLGNDTPINASYPLYSALPQREYDPDKARFHFEKSGYAGGPILLRTSDNSFPGAPDAAALFQQTLSKSGINIEIKREPNDGYWSEVWNKQPFCTSYWAGRSTQDQMYSTAYQSTADWNDTRFKSESFDQLLIAARAELDEATRQQMYADMGMIVRDEGGLICPMFNDWVDGTSDRISGWVENTKGFGLMNNYAPLKMWVTE